jgi:glycosyltransferase involved in cell wall biosynthesis
MSKDIIKYTEKWIVDKEKELFLRGDLIDGSTKLLLRNLALDASRLGFEGYENLGEHEAEVETNPSLSIIMLCYNALEYTKKAIKSIQRYTRSPYELIVIDNNSSDGTGKWLKQQKKNGVVQKLKLNKYNAGVAGGRNQGIEMATGDFILFVDNDIKAGIGWDGEILRTFEEYNDVGIVGKQGNMVESYNPIHFSKHKKTPADVGVFDVDVVPGYCFCFSREVLDRIGNQATYLGKFWHEDLDFCAKARLAGFRVKANTKINLVHYEHKSVDPKRTVTDQDIKDKFPGFENKAANVGKSLVSSNVIYIHKKYIERDSSAYGILANQLVECLKLNGAVVIRKDEIHTIPLSLQFCKGFEISCNGERFIYAHQENDRAPKDWIKAFRQIDWAFCVSNHTYEALIKTGIPKEKLINLGFNGIDPKVFNPDVNPLTDKQMPGKGYRFATVGAAQPRKGTDTLIRTFAKTFRKGDDVSLIIKNYGYGQARWVEDILKEVRTDKDCPEIVHIYEDWDRQYLARFYKKLAETGTYVSAHRAEAFGLPIIEAMACGCNVIATGWGGVKDEVGWSYNVNLVSYKLSPSTFHNWGGEPFYGKGENPQWAEIDTAELAKAMRSATLTIPTPLDSNAYDIINLYSFDTRIARFYKTLKEKAIQGKMRPLKHE